MTLGTPVAKNSKAVYELHPIEPGFNNDLPHIKWQDWSGGKSNGANGHIFFKMKCNIKNIWYRIKGRKDCIYKGSY